MRVPERTVYLRQVTEVYYPLLPLLFNAFVVSCRPGFMGFTYRSAGWTPGPYAAPETASRPSRQWHSDPPFRRKNLTFSILMQCYCSAERSHFHKSWSYRDLYQIGGGLQIRYSWVRIPPRPVANQPGPVAASISLSRHNSLSRQAAYSVERTYNSDLACRKVFSFSVSASVRSGRGFLRHRPQMPLSSSIPCWAASPPAGNVE